MADVTIRGAGIFGLSIAWACCQRGASVQIMDPFGPGTGASGGIVGALAPHVPENWNAKKAFQLDSLLLAPGFWSEVEAEGGKSAGYGRTGRLQPIADANALTLAKDRKTGAQTLWQGRAIWEVRAATDFGPWAPPSPTGSLIHDTLSARIHPRRACAALVAALGARGIQVVTECADRGAVIHASGAAGLRDLSQGRTRPVGAAVKGQAALLDVSTEPDLPQIFADGLHIIPHADGTVAVGSTSEREFDDTSSTDQHLDQVIARAQSVMPALRDANVMERWAGLRPRSRSRAPMLGSCPDRKGHFIANGGFKIGFGMAPKIAHVMADLVLENRDFIPPDFRVEASL